MMAIKLVFFLSTLRRHLTLSIMSSLNPNCQTKESLVYSTSGLQATFMKDPNMSISTAEDQSYDKLPSVIVIRGQTLVGSGHVSAKIWGIF